GVVLACLVVGVRGLTDCVVSELEPHAPSANAATATATTSRTRTKPPRFTTCAPEYVASGANARLARHDMTGDDFGCMEAAGFTRLGYRRPLDGVRALAIAMVMLVHVDRSALPHGDLGVDIFFVLSGFLITTLLLEEAAITNRIALGKFYAR